MTVPVAPKSHQLEAAEVAKQVNVDPTRGLTSDDARQRLSREGRNELRETGGVSPWRIVRDQFTSVMVLLLIAAAAVSVVVGEVRDAVAILIIVTLNAVLGFVQEYRAERAMAALKELAVPVARVRRDGRVQETAAADVVPGDVLILEAGDVVAADARVIQATQLRTQEAALTGESEPVDKDPRPLDGDLPIGDRRNMAFMGTIVASGRGEAIVVDTGMRTELGRIAGMLEGVGPQATPLQRRLDQLGRNLAIAALAIVGLIFLFGVFRGEALRVMFFTAISMAVAAVPEGLPAVVTITLALGAQRMVKRRALVRKLAAVETLGSVTVICSDKTGTLTQNQMTVAVLWVAGRRIDVGQQSPPTIDAADRGLTLLLAGGALCNAVVMDGDTPRGDPTEIALLRAADRAELSATSLQRDLPRVAELSFDSDRKRMTTVHRLERGPVADILASAGGKSGAKAVVAFTKGAVEAVLDVCTQAWEGDGSAAITEDHRKKIVAAHDGLAKDGMRVLAIAFRVLQKQPDHARGDEIERDLTCVGLAGLIDPPRAEVKAAVATCVSAGIRPVMITGDHPLTAQYIAKQLDIAKDGRVLTGAELDRLTPEEFAKQVDDVPVFARVSPAHKLEIVDALQHHRHVVAMTGDGVNDAPALKKADIGVAMGKAGTAVSKEAADMVLLDDNFATIVAAVEEGRVIYDNIRKFVKYLLTTNSAELLLMLLAPLAGMPLPLLPLQILWINLVTDGPAALTLALEPAERNVMRRPPIRADASILRSALGIHVLWVGSLMGGLTLAVGYGYWQAGRSDWQTVVFTVLALSQMAHVLAIRSNTESLFHIGLRSNLVLTAVVAITIATQLAIIYVPVFQQTLSTVSLPARDLAICVALSTIIFVAVEIEKWILRRQNRVEPV